MIKANLNTDRSVPWWAVIGAPLVGVPLIVALLALTAPEQKVSGEPEAVTTEQVELQTVDQALETSAEHMARSIVNC